MRLLLLLLLLPLLLLPPPSLLHMMLLWLSLRVQLMVLVLLLDFREERPLRSIEPNVIGPMWRMCNRASYSG